MSSTTVQPTPLSFSLSPLLPLSPRPSPLPQPRPDRRQPLGQLLLEAAIGRAVVLALDAQIVLRGDGVRAGRGRTGSPRRGRAASRRRSARRADGPARAAGGLRARRARASPMPIVAAFDFGAQARQVTAWASVSWHSGRPTNSQACAAATASGSAAGSALPTSSLARITSRRARNRTSSPPSSIRASQQSAASGSLPRMLLISALIASQWASPCAVVLHRLALHRFLGQLRG